MLTAEQKENAREVSDMLSKLDKTTVMLVKSNIELISKNAQLEKEVEDLQKAAG